MNILVGTNHLKNLGGSETFTYSIIEILKAKYNFQVEYFTFQKGIVSKRIENDLNVGFMSKQKYDLILANHNTVVEHLHQKGFIIQTCHGIYPDLEQPNLKADAFVSISQEVQNHLAEKNIPSKIILNGINLNRFYSKQKLNTELTTVLSLCHSKEANDFINNACSKIGVNFLKSLKLEDGLWDVENLINKADLVVGLGRSAYEGMACGRPVIIYDNRNYFDSFGDGYAKDILGLSLQNNCSGRYSKNIYNEEQFINELKKYNSEHGIYFRKFAEQELNIEKSVESYLSFYRKINMIYLNRKKDKNFIEKLKTKLYTYINRITTSIRYRLKKFK